MRALPLPETATAEHPEIEIPPSVKLTVPVGLLPVTVAVNVTIDPTIEGLAELESEVEAVALFTTCESVALVDEVLLPSPT